MRVELLDYTQVKVLREALKVSRNLGIVPKGLEVKIAEMGHWSVFEHVSLSFKIEDVSRALLQELARHRFVSLTVESTRYTLKKRFNNIKYLYDGVLQTDEAETFAKQNYIRMQNDNDEGIDIAMFAENTARLHDILKLYPKNDFAKYFIMEGWLVKNLVLTTNLRELMHLLYLRLDKRALPEFQELAQRLYNEIPNDYLPIVEVYLRRGNDY